ncbi:hypothetical protein ACH5RR_018225 [Cinchona calisaya]|uniref:Uncharacterized protein n=1 Tax=Cinchona calisaya TaxID=153742 RepID=A0ABD2ZMI3_9GENT
MAECRVHPERLNKVVKSKNPIVEKEKKFDEAPNTKESLRVGMEKTQMLSRPGSSEQDQLAMEEFNSAIHSSGLQELNFSGSSYTWEAVRNVRAVFE